MKRPLFVIVCCCIASLVHAQSKALEHFDSTICGFSGTKLEQSAYLLRTVLPKGIIDNEDQAIPNFLSSLLLDQKSIPTSLDLELHIANLRLSEQEIGGSLQDSICSNTKNFHANYFVIHDASTPNYKNQAFPDNINEETWPYNDVKKKWDVKKAHFFVGRTGQSHSPVYLSVPWRATKFELNILEERMSKGLFVHVELIQPRRSQTGAWKDNDIIAPNPGFTTEQYEKLALIYIIASYRRGEWMIPAYHAVLDEGIKNAHDDPQAFSLTEFNKALEKVYTQISQAESLNLWATYYYIPQFTHASNGIELRDKNEKSLNLKLSSCDWCTACIQGTVLIKTDSSNSLLNYAGRSNNLQYDCRKCPAYKKYDGYKKTGKVLWQKSSGYGQGVNNYQLVPFRSIAVDSSHIDFGSVLFIPQARGVKYNFEDTIFEHDGYFFASDMGSKIKGNHIDVFIGPSTTNPFDFITSNSSKPFVAQLIDDTIIIARLKEMHTEKAKPGNKLIRFCASSTCELGTASGYINTVGDTVIPFGRFTYCYTDTIYHIGFALDTNGTCVAIDSRGEVLYQVKWFNNGPDPISEGLFRIIQNDKIGYANAKGEIVIPPEFACTTPFENGRAKVTYTCDFIDDGEYTSMVSDQWFYINKSGHRTETKTD